MAYDVITHGGGEGLKYTFNAVAALFNGRQALGASLMTMASSFALVLMVMTMVAKQELLPTVRWFFGSLIITTALMVPKVDIIIHDRITKLKQPVANVPFMLGAFAGISSQLGDILAKQMDAIFSEAGPDYRGNGVAMASQLLSKVNHFHIRDPLMASNVRGFVQQCMVFDIAKGKYTIKELHQTDNIWKLLKDNASKARGFVYKTVDAEKQKQGKKPVKSKIVTCEEGAKAIEDAWNNAYTEAKLIYGLKLYPSVPKPAQAFEENLPLAHHYLTKLSHSAADILQQSMMSNAIDDGLLELNQLTEANAAVTAYAAKRAQAQQRVAYALQGNMASLSLSVLKVVVEILFYGLFPIIVAISIFPGGYLVLKKYLIALFWIQSWAPMYAILNMIMNVYGKTKSVAAVSTLGKGALSMYALRGLSDANEWISSVAGYAMMSVPFLSYGIIHYGAGALSQLATHFGSVTQSAASHAAEEATTGNYSMGNTTFDTHNRHNVNGFKHDTNASIATGRGTFQRADGSQLSQNRDGTAIYNRSGALPEFGGHVKLSDQVSSAFSESANKSIQSGMQESQSATENITAALNTLDEFRKNRGSDTSSQKAFSQQEQVVEESSISKYNDLVNQFSKANNIDKVLAISSFAEVSVGGSIPGIIKGQTGYRAGVNITNADTVRKAQEFSEKHAMGELLKQSMSESREGRLNFTDNEGKNYGEAISSSLNKADSQMHSAQAHFTKAESYQEQAVHAEENRVSIDQDFTKQYWDELVKSRGIENAVTIVSDPHINHPIMKRFADDEVKVLKQAFDQKSPTSSDRVKEKYEQDAREIDNPHAIEQKLKSHNEEVRLKAEEADLTGSVSLELEKEVNSRFEETRADLESKRQEMDRRKKELKDE